MLLGSALSLVVANVRCGETPKSVAGCIFSVTVTSYLYHTNSWLRKPLGMLILLYSITKRLALYNGIDSLLNLQAYLLSLYYIVGNFNNLSRPSMISIFFVLASLF